MGRRIILCRLTSGGGAGFQRQRIAVIRGAIRIESPLLSRYIWRAVRLLRPAAACQQ